MDLDAIIVTYNSQRTIAAGVASLRACPAVGRIIVVDNASADGSADVASAAGADEVLRNAGNEGFARAVNAGLRRSDAGRILLLNPDARIDDRGLRQLLEALDQDPRVALVAPVLVDEDGVDELGAARFSTYANRVGMCLPLVGRLPWLRPDYPCAKHIVESQAGTPVDVVWGAVVLADGAFLRSVGGFDERFFLFSEDEDLCRQAKACGRAVLLVGGARAAHAGGMSSSDSAVREARRLYAAGQLFEKWDGRAEAARYARGIQRAFRLREALLGAAAFSGSARRRAEEACRIRECFTRMIAEGRAL